MLTTLNTPQYIGTGFNIDMWENQKIGADVMFILKMTIITSYLLLIEVSICVIFE